MEKSIEELLEKKMKYKPTTPQDYVEEFDSDLIQETEHKKFEPSLSFEQVGEFINSQEFANLLAQCDLNDENSIRAYSNKLIGIAMDYADIFRNSGTSSIEELREILNGVVKRDLSNEKYDIIEVFEKKLKRDLGLHKKEVLTEEDIKVKNRIIDILAFKQTKFHAFNGAFLDSIKENGINPNAKMHEDKKDELNALHRKYNLFWKESIKADTGHVSYSATASVSYTYATTSPEWFNNMCNSHFQNRNYDATRKTFEDVANNFNFSGEDKARYLELFEECWHSFAGDKIYLAVVPDIVIHEYDDLLMLKLKFVEEDSSFAFRVLAGAMRAKDENVNDRTDKKIDTTNASFIKLPELKELQKRIEIARRTQREAGIEV